MNVFLIVVAVALAVACAVVVTLLAAQRRRAAEAARESGAALAAAVARAETAERARDAEREARERESVERAKAEAALEAERRSVADKVRSQEQMEKALREQFRALAGDVLGEQSRRFKAENLESMDVILKPVVPYVVRRRVNSVVELFRARRKLGAEVERQRDQLLLHYRYDLGMKQEDIAARLQISQVQVSRMEKRILQDLRQKGT